MLGESVVRPVAIGVYRSVRGPPFGVLDQCGVEVLLVNDRDAEHVRGRKTDVSGALWLRQLD